MPQKTKWTVLTYIAAHNNLEALGQRSVREILQVGSSTEVVHGVLYDGAAGAGRYIMGEPGYVARQEQLGPIDSGDPDQLIATAEWLFRAYPAEHYALVLWSHGTGWEPAEVEQVARSARPAEEAQADPHGSREGVEAEESRERAVAPGSTVLFRTSLRSMLSAKERAERAILFDDGTGHSLDTLELARVTASVAKVIGQPLEVLGMDACLMASLEVAYQIRDSVKYLAASQELVPGHSWPYEKIFGGLRTAPDQQGAEFARNIVAEYVRYYQAKPPAAGDVTQVALDLGKVSGVNAHVDAVVESLLADLEVSAPLTWAAQEACLKTETRNGVRQLSKFNYHLWDVGTLMQRLAGLATPAPLRSAAQSLHDALLPEAGAVLAEGHVGNWFDGIAGTSIYLVRTPARVSPYYSSLAFARETRWGDYVQVYRDFYT